MRHLACTSLGLLLVTLTAAVPRVAAEHGSPLLLVKPGDGSTIPRNAQIRLVSYNGEDELIWLLGREPHKVRARLESDSGVVRLYPRRYFTDHDGYGRAMISLVPGRVLDPETGYRLVLEVPSAGWRGQLASFVTSAETDRRAPQLTELPAFVPGTNALGGKLAEDERFVEVSVVARPRSGGRARRTFFLFDLTQQCIDGPTADYNVAIYNSQCFDEEERTADGALCDTLYYFTNWRVPETAYGLQIALRDLAGNLLRLRLPGDSARLDEPLGFCLQPL